MFAMVKQPQPEGVREIQYPVRCDRVRMLRERLGWSMAKVARLAGVSSSYLWEIEHGKRDNLTGDVLGRLADALGTTVDYLLGRDETSLEEAIFSLHDTEFNRLWKTADPQLREDILEYFRFKLEQQRKKQEKEDE